MTWLPAAAAGGLLAAAGAVAPPAPAEPVTVGQALVGVADVTVSGDAGRSSTRLVFSASDEPLRLRVEIVRAGQVAALVWFDETTLRVLVPGDPPACFEGPATRESLRDALGLPFCPRELVFALRAGRARQPDCGAPPDVTSRGGHVVALRRPAGGGSPAASVEFSRFDDEWPRRAKLSSEDVVLLVTFAAIKARDFTPFPPEEACRSARPVDAAAIARALGLRGERD